MCLRSGPRKGKKKKKKKVKQTNIKRHLNLKATKKKKKKNRVRRNNEATKYPESNSKNFNSTSLPTITLHLNGLNSPMKSQRKAEQMKNKFKVILPIRDSL